MEVANVHGLPKTRDRKQCIKSLGKATMVEECAEILGLSSCRRVLQDDPPGIFRGFIRETAKKPLVVSDFLVNQSIARFTVDWDTFAKGADESGMKPSRIWSTSVIGFTV